MSDGAWGFWGAIIAALISASVLFFLAYRTAKGVQADFKAEKLAEAKRDIFLGLVDHWMSYLILVNIYKIKEKDSFAVVISEVNKELVSSLHKSSFISEPKTRKEIMDFTFDFSLTNIELIELITLWYGANYSDKVDFEKKLFKKIIGMSEKAQSLLYILREELGLANDPAVEEYIAKRQKEFSKEIESKIFPEQK